MRVLPTGLQDHLNSGTTSLCLCWQLTLRSGEVIGFTDHDVTLNFGGVNFEAQAGFTGSEIQTTIGLAVDNLEAKGALSSAQLNEQRLNAGDYDHAEIEIWQVNWQDVAQRLLQRKGHLGEVRYGQGYFAAEVRGLAHLLNQPKGRVYQYGCDAELGDARCQVNLNATGLQGAATITAVREASFDVSGLSGFADDWFTRGTLKWLMGVNAGRLLAIKRHRSFANYARLDVWQVPKFAIAVGEQIVVTAGCDKQFSTCKAKFSNVINFQGFPHMPGTDFVLAVASSSDANNGASRAN